MEKQFYKNLFEIQVPVKPNNDSALDFDRVDFSRGYVAFSETHHKKFLAEVLKVSGGYSRLPEVSGVWLDGGDVYEENMIPIHFIGNQGEAFELAEFAKTHYEQLAIFVAKIGVAHIV